MTRVKNWIDFNSFSFAPIKINENGSTEVLNSEAKETEDQIKKRLEKEGVKVEDVVIIFSSDDVQAVKKEGGDSKITYGHGVDKTDAHTADSSDSLGDFGDLVVSAAEYARKGFKKTGSDDWLGYGSSKVSTDKQQIKDYFFGKGDSGIETIGSGSSGVSAFSGSTLNSGIDTSNQKAFQSKRAQEFSKENPALGEETQKLSPPNYLNIGKPVFVGSEEYKKTLDAIGKKRKSALRFLADIGVDTDLISKKENSLVAVRSTLNVKNEYPNDFTDFFILFKEDGEIDTFLGSTTPSPAFRVKDWYDYFIKLGFIKLVAQQGSYILDPGVYEFSINEEDTKSKYFGSAVLEQDGDVSFHKYGLEKSPAEAKRTETFTPGNEGKGNIKICITPALPDGKNANGLDATTSGDQVIKNNSSFQEILKAVKTNPAGSIKYILAENKEIKTRKERREERREEKEKNNQEETTEKNNTENVSESFSFKGMKYLKKFGN